MLLLGVIVSLNELSFWTDPNPVVVMQTQEHERGEFLDPTDKDLVDA